MTSTLAKQVGKFTETEIDDEIVVMHLDTGDFFSITGAGVAMWRLIDGSLDQAALISELSRLFDAPSDEIAAGVNEFLTELRDAGLLATT